MEGGHGDTLYKLHRLSVANRLRIDRILDHLKLEQVSEDQIDDALDQE